MSFDRYRPAISALFLVALTVALSGCGRRGPLEPHPDAPPEQRSRPAASAQEESRPAARPTLGGSRRVLSSPIPPPQQPFVLDALL